MSDKPDKVLMFLMLGGVMLASEGSFSNLISTLGDLFMARRPDNDEPYYIVLRNVLSVQLVDRTLVISGKPLIEAVGGKLH